jgi:sigma-E factor negative regulatory protein RseC
VIEEHGRVVSVSGCLAQVETQRRSVCDACSVQKGCGTSLLAQIMGHKRTQVTAINEIGACVNEHVVMGIKEDALVRGSMAIYAVPILAMLAGAIIGDQLAARMQLPFDDVLTAAFAITGLILGLLWSRAFSQRCTFNPDYQPVIVRRVAAADVGAWSTSRIATDKLENI